ncbi:MULTISPECIES: TetR/AcrR family transcriptional regulator [unclassified Nocardioides]|uniref:TetR/AcrR family transcriptional regulator n=1 Tax=unclassified Nocardioides TaxID=2615069 RepID=UPI000701ED63|nr:MULTISPECIES: TetR/AcrR family transcriptional regulator [unclassified Nocardioides]KRA31253.1 TetR family transcriptional regulator [Nocardioides sp. Root614]KRA87874.1 TetR family transcriptional regulator [Nocardioides sp. Root682]
MGGVTAPTPSRTRLTPDERRSQLLDLGVQLLATRSLEELSIDLLAEQAGISRGLLYHYFGGKQGFYEAVVQRAADDLYAQTAPPDEGEPLERLLVSLAGYVDYVVTNAAGYRSLVKAASGSNDNLRAIYETTFAALADRFFTADPGGMVLQDTPAVRLVIHAWQAMVEDLVLTWCDDPAGLTRDDLLHLVTGSLPTLVDLLP